MNYTENSCKNIFQSAADFFLNSSIKDCYQEKEKRIQNKLWACRETQLITKSGTC